MREDLREHVIEPVGSMRCLGDAVKHDDYRVLVNPTRVVSSWAVRQRMQELTRRKIIVDTYGGAAHT